MLKFVETIRNYVYATLMFEHFYKLCMHTRTELAVAYVTELFKLKCSGSLCSDKIIKPLMEL